MAAGLLSSAFEQTSESGPASNEYPQSGRSIIRADGYPHGGWEMNRLSVMLAAVANDTDAHDRVRARAPIGALVLLGNGSSRHHGSHGHRGSQIHAHHARRR